MKLAIDAPRKIAEKLMTFRIRSLLTPAEGKKRFLAIQALTKKAATFAIIMAVKIWWAVLSVPVSRRIPIITLFTKN